MEENKEKPQDLSVDAGEVQDEETDLMFAYTNRDDDSPDPIDLLASYLPQEDDWSAKTRIKDSHPEKLSAVEMLTEFYPEIEEYEDVLDQWVHDYEKRLTSVNGLGREEYVKILEALTGGQGTTAAEDSSILDKVMGGDNDGS